MNATLGAALIQCYRDEDQSAKLPEVGRFAETMNAKASAYDTLVKALHDIETMTYRDIVPIWEIRAMASIALAKAKEAK